jgi:uncharacterized glyoxalase superfamily protein PhnB
MKLLGLRPILRTNEIDETIDFYTRILGFSCGESNDDWGWASMRKDGVEIMVAKPNEHVPFDKPLFTGSFYITTDRVDALWEDLKDKTRVCYAIENFDWGMREFAVYDNNGYLLQFGQDMRTIS